MTSPAAHHRAPMIGLVALGGAGGALARAGVAAALTTPWATFTVNVLGAFALGALLEFFTRTGDRVGPRLLLGTGFCGAFTTYSTFAREVADRPAGAGVTLAVAEVTLGLAAAALGAWVSAIITTRRADR